VGAAPGESGEMRFEDIDPEKILIDDEKRLKYRRGDKFWLAAAIVAQAAVIQMFYYSFTGFMNGTLSDAFMPRHVNLLISTLYLFFTWPLMVYGHYRLRSGRMISPVGILYEDGILTLTGKYADSILLKTHYRLIPNSQFEKIAFQYCSEPDVGWEICIESKEKLYVYSGEKQADFDRHRRHLDPIVAKYRPEVFEKAFSRKEWFGET